MPKLRRTGFVSYAGKDAPIVERFLELMRERWAILRDLEIECWSDRRILAGDRWEDEIAAAMKKCDFGLLCVTPRFLGPNYATAVELPALLRRDTVFPVVLREVNLDTADLRGLRELQLFRYRPPGRSERRAFGNCAGPNAERFCDALVDDMVKRLS